MYIKTMKILSDTPGKVSLWVSSGWLMSYRANTFVFTRPLVVLKQLKTGLHCIFIKYQTVTEKTEIVWLFFKHNLPLYSFF